MIATGIGRNVLLQTGIPISVAASGDLQWMMIGKTIDWNLVTALSAPYTDQSGIQVPIGAKMLRFGQVMTVASGNTATNTLTLNNTPTGGTFTVTVVTGQVEQTTAALAYNISTSALATAINGLSNVSSGATVTGTAGATYTIVLPSSVGNAGFFANGSNLTGAGSPPTATFSVTTTEGGMIGPYDPNATDGRATLAIGSVGIVNETIVQGGLFGITTFNTTQVGLIEGGHVYLQRIIQAGTGSASLAAGPTLAGLLAVMPRLTPFTL
jgi:hypothetical protein